MNSLERFLYLNRIFKISEKKLKSWDRRQLTDKIIFAAQKGIYNIRIKAIGLLSPLKDEPKVRTQLIKMISDEVELVSEAAIAVLEPTANSEIQMFIDSTRAKWREVRERETRTANAANLQFKNFGREKPSERLMNILREQQKTNEPPYGF